MYLKINIPFDNQSLSLQVHPHFTVEDIRSILRESSGYQFHTTVLCDGDKILPLDKTVQELKLTENSPLQLVRTSN